MPAEYGRISLPTMGVNQIAPVDRSGTITTGGTAQAILTADAFRTDFFVQNNSAGDLRLKFGGTASSTSGIKIPAGGLLSLDAEERVVQMDATIWGATTGQAFEAMEA